MKKSGIINPDLCRAIASLGHTDSIVICDAGLPIPQGVERIDLSLVRGVPSFDQVFQEVVRELQVERAIVAEEALRENPHVIRVITEALGEGRVEFVPHLRLKELTEYAKTVVRTAEFRPYANVILYSGVEGLFEDGLPD
ncbi:MAG TPA: D-ribose pyranase [Bacillota bacterium]|nr:D-ribose pyranase [Bacillota bacterium]HOK70351.1 D-ribose pyranase [Bacillota bacterium]HOL51773.1 D-ribose pyranase [Bacillota bacterium]HOO30787.1 D-ribose pyranase [Bacillota bacterium]HPQ01974.1 D-ribose pyranase [Bacillota bacterium]